MHPKLRAAHNHAEHAGPNLEGGKCPVLPQETYFIQCVFFYVVPLRGVKTRVESRRHLERAGEGGGIRSFQLYDMFVFADEIWCFLPKKPLFSSLKCRRHRLEFHCHGRVHIGTNVFLQTWFSNLGLLRLTEPSLMKNPRRFGFRLNGYRTVARVVQDTRRVLTIHNVSCKINSTSLGIMMRLTGSTPNTLKIVAAVSVLEQLK